MHMKKALCVCLSLAIAGSVFAGCSREQTPEEIEAASLAAVTQEEQTTGMKRLDSPNLTDYESRWPISFPAFRRRMPQKSQQRLAQ